MIRGVSQQDEVIRELDVYINDTLELYLLQFPLKPVYSDPPAITAARIKPKHKRLELSIPYDPAVFSNDYKGTARSKPQKIISSRLHQHTSLGVGVIRDNSLHITPIQEVLQLRPSFKELEAKGEQVEMMSDDELDEKSTKNPQQVLVQMRKKDNEKAVSNRQSFAYLQAQEEAELWHRLNIFAEDKDETAEIFEGMFFEETVVEVDDEENQTMTSS